MTTPPPHRMKVLTQVEVEERICNVLEALEERTHDFDDLAKQAAEAEADYRRIAALTMLAVIDRHQKMTAQERTARAEATTVDAHRRYLLTRAARDSCRESLVSLREQLNALRTLAANQRALVS